MKVVIILSVLLVLSLASGIPKGATKCPKLPKGVAVKCSTAPPNVLGFTKKGHYDLFHNSCTACYGTNSIVAYYTTQQCPQWFVAPDCSKEPVQTVCGISADKEIKTYRNYCYACTSGAFQFFEGACPKTAGYSNQGGIFDYLYQ